MGQPGPVKPLAGWQMLSFEVLCSFAAHAARSCWEHHVVFGLLQTWSFVDTRKLSSYLLALVVVGGEGEGGAAGVGTAAAGEDGAAVEGGAAVVGPAAAGVTAKVMGAGRTLQHIHMALCDLACVSRGALMLAPANCSWNPTALHAHMAGTLVFCRSRANWNWQYRSRKRTNCCLPHTLQSICHTYQAPSPSLPLVHYI
jgi:hypothetical protein